MKINHFEYASRILIVSGLIIAGLFTEQVLVTQISLIVTTIGLSISQMCASKYKSELENHKLGFNANSRSQQTLISIINKYTKHSNDLLSKNECDSMLKELGEAGYVFESKECNDNIHLLKAA